MCQNNNISSAKDKFLYDLALFISFAISHSHRSPAKYVRVFLMFLHFHPQKGNLELLTAAFVSSGSDELVNLQGMSQHSSHLDITPGFVAHKAVVEFVILALFKHIETGYV